MNFIQLRHSREWSYLFIKPKRTTYSIDLPKKILNRQLGTEDHMVQTRWLPIGIREVQGTCSFRSTHEDRSFRHLVEIHVEVLRTEFQLDQDQIGSLHIGPDSGLQETRGTVNGTIRCRLTSKQMGSVLDLNKTTRVNVLFVRIVNSPSCLYFKGLKYIVIQKWRIVYTEV